mmetsp:Transcript_134226/g.199721  ORF Transcript_134226/g.199721 Transcript_134226/m.199721 type:complete len:510 (+) Transcript_134226:266-1795(+)
MISSEPKPKLSLQLIPCEVQVHMLTFLRAYDLSAVQQTCRFYNDPDLIENVVSYMADNVYSHDWTKDKTSRGKRTLEHLRNLELAVIAKILSSPEPKTGFYVSKSWIRKTLLWLEKVNEPPPVKKLTKKQLRQRDRRLSDVSPPWPNANSDILCSHECLQRCNAKSARARRRLMDKKAWKVLKKLYPDSTQLESVSGECLQCLMETETARRSEQTKKEQAKLERKECLSNPFVRTFYTRTRGVPADHLVSSSSPDEPKKGGKKTCPLKKGRYMILPRAWCHQWRRYIKTGEGGVPLPPGASEVLCHAHQFALIPPHLEFCLQGETAQLLSSVKECEATTIAPTNTRASLSTGSVPVGVSPATDPGTVQALLSAGIPHNEILAQQMAMMQIHQLQDLQQQDATTPRSPVASRDSAAHQELLNRENHVVVELVSEEEWSALRETGCWPKHLSNFCVSVTIADDGRLTYSTEPCRKCDPTGSRFQANAEVKYRRKRWEPKSVENRRIPKLEY